MLLFGVSLAVGVAALLAAQKMDIECAKEGGALDSHRTT